MALLLNAGDTVSRSYSYTQPSPLHPSLPQGTGERTGNLLDWSGNLLVVNGTVTTNQDVISSIIDVSNVNTLYFTGDIDLMNSSRYRLAKSNSAIDSGSTVDSYSSTFTGGIYDVSDCNYLLITASVYAKPSENRQLIKDTYMCNTGSTAKPYEPYGYKIPISSAGQTTPVYLGEVQTTRKIRKLVLSSSQNWQLQSINSHGIANFYITITNDFLNNTSILSNYFVRQATTIADTTTEGMLVALSTNSATVYIRINSQTASTAQEFKDWLDGLSEEVAIWYVLATEETGIVNEPLMKIGDYADTLSGVSIPTVDGANALSVDTTVQPSEVTANYHGWHPVANVHERESGQWT